MLAVEPDSERAANLKRLIESRLEADVFITGSSGEAIAALSTDLPDVLLASALLPVQDEAHVMTHVRGLPNAQHLPVLTVAPVLDSPDSPEPPYERRRLFKRRRRPKWTLFDRDAIVARIGEALDRSRMEKPVPKLRLLKGKTTDSSGTHEPPESGVIRPARQTRQKRAHRWTQADLPWLRGLQTAAGVELQILNISRTGVLVESSSKFTPDSRTDLRMYGDVTSLVVPARFVRSDIAAVDVRGVRYQAAAIFERKLDVLPDGTGASPRAIATPRALAELLVQATGELGAGRGPGAVRTAFEVGLRQLASAREVRILDRPSRTVDGSDAIYFTIPTTNGAPAVLQATFDPQQPPGPDEFALLKAGALAAAILLQYEGLSSIVAPTPTV